MRVVFALGLGVWLGACSLPDRPSATFTPPPSAVTAGLIIIQTDASPAFADVTQSLIRQWNGRIAVYQLKGGLDSPATVLKNVQASEHDLVVAVGLPAARLARTLKDKKVVFCQVFHYEDADLLAPWMKGVQALPPPAQQFAFLKRSHPRVSRLAVITGRGLRARVAEAETAAKRQGISLLHVEVQSDMEFLYAFKRVAAKVDGLWLLPDNRVLSRRVLHEVASLSGKSSKPVLAVGPSFQALPALIAVASDPADIAAQVMARLMRAAVSDIVPGADMRPLTRLLSPQAGGAAARAASTSPGHAL